MCLNAAAGATERDYVLGLPVFSLSLYIIREKIEATQAIVSLSVDPVVKSIQCMDPPSPAVSHHVKFEIFKKARKSNYYIILLK